MKIALYARVSTTDQNAEVQLADLGRYCEVRGWKIVYELVDVGSGADAERPERDHTAVEVGVTAAHDP